MTADHSPVADLGAADLSAVDLDAADLDARGDSAPSWQVAALSLIHI